MFIISLTYTQSLDTIDTLLEAHKAYLTQQYLAGHFIASGKKVSRTGGVILSDLSDKIALMDILKQDPFYQNNVAAYEVTEFEPSMTSKELKHLIPV